MRAQSVCWRRTAVSYIHIHVKGGEPLAGVETPLFPTPARRAGKSLRQRFRCVGSSPRSEMADPQQAVVFRSKVRAGDLVAVRKMLQAGVDFTQPGKTLREWTPLHTAAWGTAKPQNDRDIVEALLTAAHKSGKGKEEALRSAKDAKDGSAQHAQDAGARVPRHGWLARGGPRRSGGGRPCRSGGGGRACGTRTSLRPLNRQARRRWTWRGSVARRWVRVLQRRARRAEKSKRRVARGGPGRHACPRVAPRSSPPSSLGPARVARRSRPHLGPQPPTRLRFFSLLHRPRRKVDRIIEWLQNGVMAG